MLELHIRTQGGIGPPLSDRRQVLPSESESSVQRLLEKLREEG